MTQLEIRSTISVGTRTLLIELLGNAQQAVQDDILETVSDVKILAAHLAAIVAALEDGIVHEPQVNRGLCSVLQTLPMAYEFNWSSILPGPDFQPYDVGAKLAEVKKAKATKKRKTA